MIFCDAKHFFQSVLILNHHQQHLTDCMSNMKMCIGSLVHGPIFSYILEILIPFLLYRKMKFNSNHRMYGFDFMKLFCFKLVFVNVNRMLL